MTLTFHINFDSIFYLPDWVVHPTLVDPFLFPTAGAEQAGRAKGWSPAQALWAGFFKQRDFFERSEIEIRCPRCEAPLPTNHNNDNKYPKNIENNDFYNDKPPKSDNDNLTDGTEDANHNGRIDGDNGDGTYQPESERWKETNPNNDDTDEDGIDDKTEIQSGYNAMKKDTDSDGLDDGEEDKNGNGEKESTETDPTKIDTDGDGLSDFMELEGWTVCIIFEATSEISTKYKTNSDPNIKDTENDGVSDYDEYRNTTDPNKADSDGDGKTDFQELSGDYNSSATGIDGEPPEIWYYDCQYVITETELGLLKVPSGLEVWMIVGARDIFGIDNLEIFISGLEDRKIFANNDDNLTVGFEWKLSGVNEYKRAFFDGFKINVTATDINGNVGFRNEELDSIKDIVVTAFLGPLLALVDFISELVSGIFDWIYDVITETLDIAMKKIHDVVQFLTSLIQEKISKIGNAINDNEMSDAFNSLMTFLDHPIFFIILGIDIALFALCMLLNTIPLVTLVTVLIGLIISIVVILIMSTKDEEGDSPLSNIIRILIDSIVSNFNIEEEESKNKQDDNLNKLSNLIHFFEFLGVCAEAIIFTQISKPLKSDIGFFIASLLFLLIGFFTPTLYSPDVTPNELKAHGVILLIAGVCWLIGAWKTMFGSPPTTIWDYFVFGVGVYGGILTIAQSIMLAIAAYRARNNMNNQPLEEVINDGPYSRTRKTSDYHYYFLISLFSFKDTTSMQSYSADKLCDSCQSNPNSYCDGQCLKPDVYIRSIKIGNGLDSIVYTVEDGMGWYVSRNINSDMDEIFFYEISQYDGSNPYIEVYSKIPDIDISIEAYDNDDFDNSEDYYLIDISPQNSAVAQFEYAHGWDRIEFINEGRLTVDIENEIQYEDDVYSNTYYLHGNCDDTFKGSLSIQIESKYLE